MTENVTEKSKLDKCKEFCWNKETETCIGRTKSSWAKILVFFSIYYIVLAGLCIGMMSVFLYGFLSDDVPSVTGEHSRIKNKPGLSVFPLPNVADTLIRFNDEVNKIDYLDKEWLQNDLIMYKLNETLDKIKNVEGKCKRFKPCSVNDWKKEGFCEFDRSFAQNCIDHPITDDSICIFLKVNKVFGWLPKQTEMNITCNGRFPGDKSNIIKQEVFPKEGSISNNYFPFHKKDCYDTPFIVIKFTVKKYIPVMIRCTAKIDGNDRSVKFELVNEPRKKTV